MAALPPTPKVISVGVALGRSTRIESDWFRGWSVMHALQLA